MESILREIDHCEAEIEQRRERRKRLEDELTGCIRTKNTENILNSIAMLRPERRVAMRRKWHELVNE